MIRIALLAALPQEYKTWLNGAGRVRRTAGASHPTYRWETKGNQFILVETGMGGSRIPAIVTRLLAEDRIDGLISTGFAGACSPRLAVGDVIVGRRFILHQGASRGRSLPGLRAPETGLNQLVRNLGARPCDLLTIARPLPKKGFARPASDVPLALDMETAHLALAAHRSHLPFCSIRSISDALEDDFDFDVSQLTDSRDRIHAGRVLISLCGHPRWLPQFYRAWRRARIAADSLASILSSLLNLEQDQWRRLLEQSRVRSG